METHMSRLQGPRAFLLLTLALVLVGCPPKRVGAGPGQNGGYQEPTRPKFEPKQQASADAELEQAIHLADQGRRPEALEAYLSVRKSYPESTAGQQALYRAGLIYFEQEQYARAREAFTELIFENPLFEQGNDARLKLGLSLVELGAYRDAYQTLNSLAQRTTGPEQAAALRAAERAATEGQLFSDALKLAVRRVDDATTGQERDEALARVVDLVEGQAPFVEVARVQTTLSPSHPAWPVLTFKLARIYYHLRDWTRLNETLEAFLRHAPAHPFAADARQLLARSQRRSEVRPRRVGVILPMTGRFKPLGDAVLRGVQLALEGSEVELVVKDSRGDVMVTSQAMEDLVFEDGAIAVLGPLLTDDAQRAALMAEELQIPVLTLTRQEGITRLGPWVFRNMLTNSAQAQALARYATEELGYKNFGVLFPNIPYGVELTNEFWDELDRRGAEVRAAESYDHDQTTFTREARKLVGRFFLEDRHDYLEGVREIQQSGQDAFRRRKAMERLRAQLRPIVDFEALFIPDDWRRVGLVAPALAVEDIITNACDPRDLERIRKTTGRTDLRTVTLLGTNQWSSPKGRSGVAELVERGGKFVTCSIYVDGFYVDSERPGTKRFVQRWRERYKDRDPGLLEASGYDAALMLRQIVETGRPTDRVAFRQQLADLQGFEGATGRTTFDEVGEPVKELFFITIDQKGLQELTVGAKKPAS
jgi:branched-chain amino acid transport system substrate-binding protein